MRDIPLLDSLAAWLAQGIVPLIVKLFSDRRNQNKKVERKKLEVGALMSVNDRVVSCGEVCSSWTV